MNNEQRHRKKIPQGAERVADLTGFCLVSDGDIFKRLNEIEKNLTDRFDQIEKKYDEEFKKVCKEIRESEGRISSRMRELEANVRDISSIKGAVGRMGVGFQEIPYQMNGNSAVERIKDYY